MPPPIDIIGQTFGDLTVTNSAPPTYSPKRRPLRMYTAQCVCGVTKDYRSDLLRMGKVKSCGCTSRQRTIAALTRHGHSARGAHSPEYRAWAGMIDRCTNPKFVKFAYYGGRGITVCARWRESFAAFLADMGCRPTAKHEIDRIDVNGHYEPSNVRWATYTEQARNTSRNHKVSFNGKTLCLAEWEELLGIKAATIRSRLKRGQSVEAALSPARRSIHSNGGRQNAAV